MLYKSKKIGSLKFRKAWRKTKKITVNRGEPVIAINKRLTRKRNSRIIKEEISPLNFSEKLVTLSMKSMVKIEAIARIQPKYWAGIDRFSSK